MEHQDLHPRLQQSKECGTCRMPLSAQKQLNQTIELPNPKATLTSAVAMRPPASSFVGDDRAPSTPDANLEKPYLRAAAIKQSHYAC